MSKSAESTERVLVEKEAEHLYVFVGENLLLSARGTSPPYVILVASAPLDVSVIGELPSLNDITEGIVGLGMVID